MYFVHMHDTFEQQLRIDSDLANHGWYFLLLFPFAELQCSTSAVPINSS